MTTNDMTVIIYMIVKIALVVFSLMHFMALIFLSRQIRSAVTMVKTKSHKEIVLFAFLHAIILFVVFLIIIILPLK